MSRTLRPLCLALALCLPWSAHAIDATATVKVTPLLKTDRAWNGVPIVYPAGQAEVTALVVEIAAGGVTGWHEHPVPSFAYILEGELEVTRASGEVRRLGPGDTLAEVVNTVHQGRALGDKPAKLLVFYIGARNTPLTVAHPELQPPRPPATAAE